uniref:DUF7808 domain-containing protein n=1 Tax=Ascaris suum TaxID=6253 RepID=F1LBQ5_ASCSU
MNELLIASLFIVQLAIVNAESVHWQWRDISCETKNGVGPDKLSKEPAECKLSLRETGVDGDAKDNKRPAPGINAGCFDENVNGTIRTYCDLLCPNAESVYLIKREPQVHRSCFVFYTHGKEKRGNDWYLWRSKSCRQSAITFTIRCEFPFGRKEFPNDEQLFTKLRKRTQ